MKLLNLLKFNYGMLRISGFVFVKIDFTSAGGPTMKRQFREFILFIVSICLSLSSTLYNSYFPVARITHSKLMEIGVNFLPRLMIFSTLVVKISSWVRSKSFLAIISKLHFAIFKVKKNIEFISGKFNSVSLQNKNISVITKPQSLLASGVAFTQMIIFEATYVIVINCFNIVTSLSWKNRFCFLSAITANLIVSTSMMMLTSFAYYQLNAFNLYLKQCLKHPGKVSILKVVKKASIMHDNFCDAFEAISVFYLFNILTYLFGFWYFDIFFVYEIFIYLKAPNDEIMWFFFYSNCTMWMIIFSSWATNEGKRTANLIEKMVVLTKDTKVAWKANILIQQVTHRSPKISCEMFDLNWKFFFSTIGAVFSFSIILIQFYDVANY